MKLMGSYGGSVEKIYCNAAQGMDVIHLDSHGEQTVTLEGSRLVVVDDVEDDDVYAIPDDCPLRAEAVPSVPERKIENFAACIACPNAVIIDSNGLTEC